MSIISPTQVELLKIVQQIKNWKEFLKSFPEIKEAEVLEISQKQEADKASAIVTSIIASKESSTWPDIVAALIEANEAKLAVEILKDKLKATSTSSIISKGGRHAVSTDT